MARAKRSQAQSEEMRERLVAATRRIIAEKGLGAVTARGLAAELGWSVGTIYTVAPSIDAVTLEANAAELTELCAALENARERMVQSGSSPAELIRAFGEIYLHFATARPRSWAAIFERDAEGEPPDWYRDRQTRLFAILERSLSPLVTGAEQTRRAARTLWAALHGLLALSVAGHLARVSGSSKTSARAPQTGPQIELLSHAHELIDVFLAGLQARDRDRRTHSGRREKSSP